MEKYVLCICLSVLLGTTYCWGGNGPGKLRLSENKTGYTEDFSPKWNGSTSMTMAWRRNSFLNGEFFSNTQDGTVTPSLGWTISYSYYVLSHVEIEATYFRNYYHLNTSAVASERAFHQGFEFFGNLYVLPPLGAWTRVVCPYVGAGYQTSSLQALETEYSTGTGGFIAKGGVRFYISNGLNLRAEYKQTLPVSSSKLFRSVEIGVSMSL